MKHFLVHLGISALTDTLCTTQETFITLISIYCTYYVPRTSPRFENTAVEQTESDLKKKKKKSCPHDTYIP